MSDLPAFHSTLLLMMEEMNNKQQDNRDLLREWYGITAGSESQFYPPNEQQNGQEGAYWNGSTAAESASWQQWTNPEEAQVTFDLTDTGQTSAEDEKGQRQTYAAGEGDREVTPEITNIRSLSESENESPTSRDAIPVTFDLTDTGQRCAEEEKQHAKTYAAGEVHRDLSPAITNVRSLNSSENQKFLFKEGLCDDYVKPKILEAEGSHVNGEKSSESCGNIHLQDSDADSANQTCTRLQNDQSENDESLLESPRTVTEHSDHTNHRCDSSLGHDVMQNGINIDCVIQKETTFEQDRDLCNSNVPDTETCAVEEGIEKITEEVVPEITNVRSLSASENQKLPLEEGLCEEYVRRKIREVSRSRDHGESVTDVSEIENQPSAEKKNYTCSVCGIRFKNASVLKKHMSVHNDESYECFVCKMRFSNRKNGHRHLREMHNGLAWEDLVELDTETFTGCQNNQCKNGESHSGTAKTITEQSDNVHHSETSHRLGSEGQAMHNGISNGFVNENTINQGSNKLGPSESDLSTPKNHTTGDRRHKCRVCGKTFKRASHLKDHVFIHTTKKPFECSICKKGFTRRRAAARHIRVMHSSEISAAEIVSVDLGLIFLEENGDGVNHREHEDGVEDGDMNTDAPQSEPVVADNEVEPDISMSNRKVLDMPVVENEHPFVKEHSCCECSKSFSSMLELRAHMSTNHATAKLECFVCKRPFNRPEDLKRHLERAHKGTTFDELGDSVIKRLVCFQDDLSSKLGLDEGSIEQAILVDDANKSCSEIINNATQAKDCRSDEQSAADVSVVRKRPSPSDRHTCSVCCKQFTSSSRLREHMYSHTWEKPFRCSVCDKSYKRLRDLRYHVKERHPEICNHVCQCGEKFATETQLVVHRRVHFRCPTCQVILDDEASYNAHMAEHREKCVKCPECEQVFLWHGSINAHLHLHEMGVTKECLHCRKSFCTLEDCARHIMTHADIEGGVASEAFRNAVRFASQSSDGVLHNGVELAKSGDDVAIVIKENMAQNGKDGENSASNLRLPATSDTTSLKQAPSLKRSSETRNGGESTKRKQVGSENGLRGDKMPPTKMTRYAYDYSNEERCPICEYLCPNHEAYKKHMIRHREKTIKCPHCPIKCRTRGEMRRHSKVHFGQKRHGCLECGRGFHEESQLEEHRERVHPLETGHKCSACRRTFGTAGELENHAKSHCWKLSYSCHKCGREFSNHAAQFQHLVLCCGGKPFQCIECRERFTDKLALNRHMQLHAEKTLGTNCNHSFRTVSSYIKHIRTCGHRRSRGRFECVQCRQTFEKKSKLNVHMRRHAGIKPHKCPLCNEKYFYTNSDRARHIRIVHKEESYHICAICNMRFATKEEKVQHRECTKEEIHNCLLCDQRFSKVCDLNQHIKIHTEEIQ